MRVMTYNLRVDAPEDGDWRWPARAATVLADIRRNAPDILIVTEAETAHLATLRQLRDYTGVAVPRADGRTRGEAVGVFWRTAALHLVATHHEWLSPTPSRPSVFPGARYPRTLQQVTLQADSGLRWTVIGTHLDHVCAAARDYGAARLVALAQTLPGPLVIGGDFNAPPTSRAVQLMTTVLADAQAAAQHRDAAVAGTYRPDHRFAPPLTQPPRRIDYLFVSPTLTVTRYAIDTTRPAGGRWGSDHWPVIADLRAPQG